MSKNDQLVLEQRKRKTSASREAASGISHNPFLAVLPDLGKPEVLSQAETWLFARHALLQRMITDGQLAAELAADEIRMLAQALSWLGVDFESSPKSEVNAETEYGTELVLGLYNLGRMYYELGYRGLAHRVFEGLVRIDRRAESPAKIGVAALYLEQQDYKEALVQFRDVIENSAFALEGKLGLCAVFVAQGELERGKQLLLSIQGEIDAVQNQPKLISLWEALLVRCEDP